MNTTAITVQDLKTFSNDLPERLAAIGVTWTGRPDYVTITVEGGEDLLLSYSAPRQVWEVTLIAERRVRPSARRVLWAGHRDTCYAGILGYLQD